MKAGYEVFYINGSKFYVCVRDMNSGYSKPYQAVEVCQQRYLSGNAYDETGNHGKSWFRNVSKKNYSLAIQTYKLLSLEAQSC
jgi:hypothetical protein